MKEDLEYIKGIKSKELKATAASVAVALALKAEREAIRDFPLPERVILSAWQAVLRSNVHSTRGNVR